MGFAQMSDEIKPKSRQTIFVGNDHCADSTRDNPVH